MKTKNNVKEKGKKSISIVLIIIWMGYMILRNILKLLNTERFELNSVIFGKSFTLFNWVADFLIAIAFLVVIVLFFLRKRNSWKYFIYLMVILIIGVIISLFYIDQLKVLLPSDSQEAESFVLVFTYIINFLLILFYSLLAYIVYKKKEYFSNHNANPNKPKRK